MALPRQTDAYDSYTDQLVYFSARLAANPATAPLADGVAAVLDEIDRDQVALRDARREEIRRRAVRDHRDDHGDEQTRRLRRRIGGEVDADHFVVERLFPRSAAHVMAPRGRAQLDRLHDLVAATEEALQSPWLTESADAAQLSEILTAGKAQLEQALVALTEAVEAWETQTLAVSRARDSFDFRRADGVERLGVVLGELRARLGGSARAAYAYTQPARRRDREDDDTPDTPTAAAVPAE